MLFEEISCSLFTAFWRDFGTSSSVKVSRSEFPRTVLPLSSSAISSTLKRWLLFAICPAARCSSSCVGCGRSALARVCIACWKSPSTASCVRVSTASRLSQYAIPDADTAAVSATSPNTTTRRSRRLVKRRPASIVLRAAAQPRSLSCGLVTEDCPAGSRLPERYGSGWARTARPPPSRAAAAHTRRRAVSRPGSRAPTPAAATAGGTAPVRAAGSAPGAAAARSGVSCRSSPFFVTVIAARSMTSEPNVAASFASRSPRRSTARIRASSTRPCTGFTT